MSDAKIKKSSMRFQQINLLCDRVIRNLPSAAHRLLLIVCWRHADADRLFQCSIQNLADSCGLSKRHTTDLMKDLQQIGSLVVVCKGNGRTPAVYKITGKPRDSGELQITTKGRRNGEPQITTKLEIRGEPQITTKDDSLITC